MYLRRGLLLLLLLAAPLASRAQSSVEGGAVAGADHEVGEIVSGGDGKVEGQLHRSKPANGSLITQRRRGAEKINTLMTMS